MSEEEISAIPQINLENILALGQITEGMLRVKGKAMAEYEGAMSALFKAESTKNRVRKGPFWNRKDFYILDEEFFKEPGGRHRELSKSALYPITEKYREKIEEIEALKPDLTRVVSCADKIRSAATGLLKYFSSIIDELKLRDPRLTPDDLSELSSIAGYLWNPKASRRQASKRISAFVSQTREKTEAEANTVLNIEDLWDADMIQRHIDFIYDAVREYNSAMAELTGKLPHYERADLKKDSIETTVQDVNTYLGRLSEKPLAKKLIEYVRLLDKSATELQEGVKSRRSSLLSAADFSTMHLTSSKFASLAERQGFTVYYLKGYFGISTPEHALKEVHSSE